jgi:hypothetical protein
MHVSIFWLFYGHFMTKQDRIGDAVGETSRTTLTKYMDELVQAKILTPKKDGTEVYYLNDDLIRILER